MTRKILFFDDYPLDSLNQLFTFRLLEMLRGTNIDVVIESTVPRLEELLRSEAFAAVILDIMAAMPESPSLNALAGLEVLKRCRAASYGELNRSTRIYVRTARNEVHVRDMTHAHGGAFFLAGSQDDRLIAALRRDLFDVETYGQ